MAISLVLFPFSAFSEWGIGTIASEWDPITEEFKTEYRDWQEGVVYDETTGDYVVTYKDSYDSFNEVVFVPATKIDPDLRSKFKQGDQSTFQYDYLLKSNKSSRQAIRAMVAVLSADIQPNPSAPQGWKAYLVPDVVDNVKRVSWAFDADTGGVRAGQTQTGFHIQAPDLPGVGWMQLSGEGKGTVWLGHYPTGEIGEQMDKIKENNFVTRLAVVPAIPIEVPFGAAAVLTKLQSHVKNDLHQMGLVDPTLATHIDRQLQAAIDAAKHGNQVALRAELKTLRQTLKRAHPELAENEDADEDWGDDDKRVKRPIAKLAAKVLDFDLKYVLKRVGDKD